MTIATDIQQLYVAFFNRPADSEGLNYWTVQANKNGGSVAAVANAFSASAEYQSVFGGLNNADTINLIYQNLFGRPAEKEGLVYWSDAIDKGLSISKIAQAIAAGAQNDDATAVHNKVVYAVDFTNASADSSAEIIGYSGAAANAVAKAQLLTITDNASLAAAVANIDANVAAAVAAHNNAATGTVFTLTTGSDAGAAFTGSSGNDVFTSTAVLNAAGTAFVDTLQSLDQINGGAGNDTLNATLTAATVTPTLTSIENVNLRAAGLAPSVLDLSASTGVTNVSIAGSIIQAGVLSVGTANLAVANQNAEADFSGSTATALNLNLNTIGKPILTGAHAVVDVAKTVAAAATSLNITANNANADLRETTASAVVSSASVAATGANQINLSAADAATVKTLTVTGAGSVDFSGQALSGLTTITAGDGGVKVTSTNATAAAVTATTGAGADTLVLNGGSVKSVSTGAGVDKVTLNTAALSATSTVSLGDGNDTVTITGAAPAGGAVIDGGAGVDTFATTQAIYTGVAALTAPNRALISNFETLSITDSLAGGAIIDVSKLAGVVNFTAAAGVVAGLNASVTNLGAGSTVTIAGANTGTAATPGTAETATFNFVDLAANATEIINGVTVTAGAGGALAADVANAFVVGGVSGGATATGTNTAGYTATHVGGSTTADVFTASTVGDQQPNLSASGTAPVAATVVNGTAASLANAAGGLTIALATDTAADSVTLVLNNNFVENNDTVATVNAFGHTVTSSLIETLTVQSTGTASTAFLAGIGTKADSVMNTLTLTDNDIVTLKVTGDQALTFNSTAAMTKLATIDASANTGGLTFSGVAADMTTATSAVAMTITGSATASNNLTGSGRGDTIVGGAKADTITGGKGGDTLTGGAGTDKFIFAAGDSTIATGNADTITDFTANTFGAGVNGAVTSAGANGVAATSLTGDVIQLHNFAVGATQTITVGVYTNASDATTFLQTQSATEGAAAAQTVHAALNSTTGDLYVDIDGNGTADLYIHLTGVTTITAAAFTIV